MHVVEGRLQKLHATSRREKKRMYLSEAKAGGLIALSPQLEIKIKKDGIGTPIQPGSVGLPEATLNAVAGL